MDIYVYADESGVFDHIHNDYYVYGGLILLGEEEKLDWTHRYAAVERSVRENRKTETGTELKASLLSNKYKSKIFRALNGCHKFACVVNERKVNKNIWNSKKDRQRYLDYVFKISVKRAFEELIMKQLIKPSAVSSLYFSMDEHSTATNGKYELRESLEQEFRFGTFNPSWSRFFPPIFPLLRSVNLALCNSSAPGKKLIRASDIVANRVYYLVTSGQTEKLRKLENITVTFHPAPPNRR